MDFRRIDGPDRVAASTGRRTTIRPIPVSERKIAHMTSPSEAWAAWVGHYVAVRRTYTEGALTSGEVRPFASNRHQTCRHLPAVSCVCTRAGTYVQPGTSTMQALTRTQARAWVTRWLVWGKSLTDCMPVLLQACLLPGARREAGPHCVWRGAAGQGH